MNRVFQMDRAEQSLEKQSAAFSMADKLRMISESAKHPLSLTYATPHGSWSPGLWSFYGKNVQIPSRAALPSQT